MRHTPRYLLTDEAEVARLVDANPWATFVSHTTEGLIASHYPVMRDLEAKTLTLLSHFGRPDDELHELGQHEILVIIQGPHDYVSPTRYEPGDDVPTWNHVTAHLYGTPEILSTEDNYAVLEDMVQRFEGPHGRQMGDRRTLAKGTAGLRLRVERFDARAKLSQNKSAEVRERLTEYWRRSNPDLAAEMDRFAP